MRVAYLAALLAGASAVTLPDPDVPRPLFGPLECSECVARMETIQSADCLQYASEYCSHVSNAVRTYCVSDVFDECLATQQKLVTETPLQLCQDTFECTKTVTPSLRGAAQSV